MHQETSGNPQRKEEASDKQEGEVIEVCVDIASPGGGLVDF